ncbi:SpoIIE family protein phosphatase [Chloroflexota bacterium]
MKEKLRLNTIGGKIILSIVIVIAICVLFSAFIVSQVVQDQLGDKYKVDKVAATESLSYSLAPVLDLYDYKQVERIITSSLTYENIAHITVFDKGGILIVSAAEQNVATKDLDVEKYEITRHDKVIGSIDVGFSREYINDQIQTTTVALISGLAGFLILVGLALFTFINRSVTNPLVAFTKTVREMDSENLSLRVNIHSKDELGTLAGSFNKMAEDLGQSHNALKKAHGEVQQIAEEWKTTFHSISDLLSVHDEDMRIVKVNETLCDFFKMKPDEIIGKHCYEIFHGTNEPLPGCPHIKTTISKKLTREEIFEPSLGCYLEVSTSPVFDEKENVSSTVHIVQDIGERKKAEAEHLVHQKVVSELTLASQIQASFLPKSLPHLPGWQLAATLIPAKETAGDFYDLIPLSNGRLGVLIGDVADKGLGAAMYMALSRTLIRTYAPQYDSQPELVLSNTNKRLLTDSSINMFVTVFYGILDTANGTLTYCNAGHNPPYLLKAQNDKAVQELHNTGMVLGAVEDVTLKRETVQLAAGDMLLLYTDGVTEAQNLQQELFGEKRLMETLQANRKRPAKDIQDSVLAEVQKFVGDAPQFDDITLVVTTATPVQVLVIDDEPTIGQLFKASLSKHHYNVTTTLSGLEALKLISDRQFDMIFLDLVLKDTDGSEVFKHIQEIDRNMPVVIISAFPDSDIMSRAMEYGPFVVLKKPFDSNQILAVVNRIIRSSVE